MFMPWIGSGGKSDSATSHLINVFLWAAASQAAAEKRTISVIPSEARNLLFFVFL
jgi:hypothetical protein